jgi:hypothetical protein
MRMIVIPDVQVRAGVPTDHIEAAANYCVAHEPDKIVVIGDWWDCPSLNKFATNLELEGARISEDMQAGKDAMNLFMSVFTKENKRRKKKKLKSYNPDFYFCVGNHDPQVRIPRLISQYPILEGFIKDDSTEFLEGHGYTVVPFLEILTISDIRFSHYFQNMHSAKKGPLSGSIVTMLKNAGFSFVMGHQQGKKIYSHLLGDGTRRLGACVGSFYQHKETYEGVQGTNNWMGIIVMNEVKLGGADICEVSLEYLLEEHL